MNVNRLRYFVTVVETGSIRRAAELLHITPAALSKAVGQLEKETGLTLLVARGRGITPTTRGISLARQARRVLDEVEVLEAVAAAQVDGARSIVRVGTSEVFGTYFLGRLAAKLGDTVSLVVQAASPGDIERGVADGMVDVGITFVPVASEGVEHEELGEIRMACFARPGAFDEVPFASVPFAIPARRLTGVAARASTSDGWPVDAPLRNVAYQVGTIEAALELARGGHAACFVPEFVVELHNAQVLAKHRLVPLVEDPVAGTTLAAYAVESLNRVPSPELAGGIAVVRDLVMELG